MSSVTVNLFCNVSGSSPVEKWMDKQSSEVQEKFDTVIEILGEQGHKIKRKNGAYLRDDIYELRFKVRGTHYRVLYFFHDRQAVVLTNGFSKDTDQVPKEEIQRALTRKVKVEDNPDKHTKMFEVNNE